MHQVKCIAHVTRVYKVMFLYIIIGQDFQRHENLAQVI